MGLGTNKFFPKIKICSFSKALPKKRWGGKIKLRQRASSCINFIEGVGGCRGKRKQLTTFVKTN